MTLAALSGIIDKEGIFVCVVAEERLQKDPWAGRMPHISGTDVLRWGKVDQGHVRLNGSVYV